SPSAFSPGACSPAGSRSPGRRRKTSARPSGSEVASDTMARGEIELSKLTKEFAEVRAVDAIDLHVPGGEFFSLLGPSGCGKTTTLRMIAGFEQPTSGESFRDGTEV